MARFANKLAHTGEVGSEKRHGALRLANSTEAAAQSSTKVAVSPARVAAAVPAASTSTAGKVELATDSEARTGQSTSIAMTPANVSALKQYTEMTLNASPVMSTAANTGGAASGATGDENLMVMQEGVIMEQHILGAGQTIIAPRIAADGLLISLDLTDNEGAEYGFGITAASKHAYTAQTDACFFEVELKLADVSGCDPVYIGFRKAEAYQATWSDYSDYALIGVNTTANAGTITIDTELNGGGATQTDTTDTWSDGETKVLSVDVAASGAVTFTIDGAAPSTTAAFTFDSGDVIVPCIYMLHGTTSPGAIHLVSMKCGLQ